MKCLWFADHFLTCFPLDFPRHIREVKPGADNSDLYLCGCNTVLAPVDPLHSQAEEGKNRQGSPCGTCLSLAALCSCQKNFPRLLGLSGLLKKNSVPLSQHQVCQSSRSVWITLSGSWHDSWTVLCKARN